MVCKTCGTECGDESVCPMCGCNPNEEFGVDMGGESANNAPRQTTNDEPVGAIPQNNNQHDEPVDPIKEKKSLPGMGWFKFTIYFSLWANMALNILNAILMWTGASYGVDAERVYEVFPSLKGTDVFIGVLYLALAVYAIFVRIRLANFKKGSPMLLHILVAANLGITLLYAIIASGITGISFGELISGNIAQMIGVAVLLVVNIVYYNKHADLFTNEVGATASVPVVTANAPTGFEVMTPANGEKVIAPFPGLIKKLLVAEGTVVKRGQPILVLEAMKMDNDITAVCDGVIHFQVMKGTNVESDAVLAVIA